MKPYLEKVGEILGKAAEGEEQILKDVTTVLVYEMYLVNLLDDAGLVYRGESFKYSVPISCLVVKAVDGDRGVVAFINGRTNTACKRIFLRRLAEGTVEWREDRFF